MGGDTVEEPAVVAYYDSTAGEVVQCIFQRPKGIHIQVIGRLVEHDHIATSDHRLRQMDAVALTAGQ